MRAGCPVLSRRVSVLAECIPACWASWVKKCSLAARWGRLSGSGFRMVGVSGCLGCGAQRLVSLFCQPGSAVSSWLVGALAAFWRSCL